MLSALLESGEEERGRTMEYSERMESVPFSPTLFILSPQL
jgi:hypothetical protein